MKATDSTTSPKQIEVVVKLPDQWAPFRAKLIPQLQQLPPLESLKGIYRFELLEDGTQRLVWCFSSDGMQPPDEFKVFGGSQRTLVTLERLDPAAAKSRWATSVVSGDLISMLD